MLPGSHISTSNIMISHFTYVLYSLLMHGTDQNECTCDQPSGRVEHRGPGQGLLPTPHMLLKLTSMYLKTGRNGGIYDQNYESTWQIRRVVRNKQDHFHGDIV